MCVKSETQETKDEVSKKEIIVELKEPITDKASIVRDNETKQQGKRRETVRTLIYTGPTIPGTVRGNTIFNNGLPEELQELSKREAAIKKLIVPLEELGKQRRELNRKGSAVSVCYQKVLSGTKEGKKDE